MQSIKENILNDLLSLSHTLGDENKDYVIIGEGNTSARIDSDTFWIKASGQNLRTIEVDGFLEIHIDRVLSILQDENASDEEVTRVLMEARVDRKVPARPSVETMLHAAIYHLTDTQFIGHTHATAVNIILCSQHAQDITSHHFPDAIVVCGEQSVFVPYTDPGLPLARQVASLVSDFIHLNSHSPHVIYLQNHGLIALGQSFRQVENITAMAVKNARILAGTYSLGGPHFLSDQAANRIHMRPDEEVRRKQFR